MKRRIDIKRLIFSNEVIEGVCACGRYGEGVEYVRDPFVWDVHDEVVYDWFCSECWQIKNDDI